MSIEAFQKQDRVARLLHVLVLLQASPSGLTTQRLAEEMGVHQRTAQRDLRALEEIGIPLMLNGVRWRLVPGYFMPPVNLNLHEAMAMLLAARLMLRFADRQDHFTVAAFRKLAALLPDPIKAPLLDTIAGLSDKASDAAYTKVLAALTSAWAERRKAVITYTMERTFERTVWPLFLEPSAMGHSCYLVAFDQKLHAVRSYRVERVSAVRLLDERFDPPLGFSIADHLANAWTIWSSADPVDVELVFSASVAKRVCETRWHASQSLERLPDGRVRLRLRVASTLELKHWVLGWGAECEVLRPETFRAEMAAEVSSMAAVYGRGGDAMTRMRELVAGAEGQAGQARERPARVRSKAAG